MNRAVALALLCLTLLSGIATQASAQTLPTVSFAERHQTVDETAGTHNVKLMLSQASTSDITVNYSINQLGAKPKRRTTLGKDFTIANAGTVTVPAGATTATIPVTIIDDTEGEHEEAIVLLLTKGTGYRFNPAHWQVGPSVHVLTISTNDDPLPWVRITTRNQTVGEGSGTLNVDLTLDPAPKETITIKYKSIYRQGYRATPGSDYGALPGALTVPAGATTATIPVTIIDDAEQEKWRALCSPVGRGQGIRDVGGCRNGVPSPTTSRCR